MRDGNAERMKGGQLQEKEFYVNWFIGFGVIFCGSDVGERNGRRRR